MHVCILDERVNGSMQAVWMREKEEEQLTVTIKCDKIAALHEKSIKNANMLKSLCVKMFMQWNKIMLSTLVFLVFVCFGCVSLR